MEEGRKEGQKGMVAATAAAAAAAATGIGPRSDQYRCFGRLPLAAPRVPRWVRENATFFPA